MIESENKVKTGADLRGAADVSTMTNLDMTKTGKPAINPDDLHDLFEGPSNGDRTDPEDPFAQMRNDPNYAALMKDLEAIAEAARQLFDTAEDEPSDKVWDKIVGELGKEKSA